MFSEDPYERDRRERRERRERDERDRREMRDRDPSATENKYEAPREGGKDKEKEGEAIKVSGKLVLLLVLFKVL